MAVTSYETDVLVIGGGGAGFKAAIGSREKDVKVTLISKGPLAHCGATPMAGADYTLDGNSMSKIDGLAGDPEDSAEKVFNDIVTQGCFLNNQKLVEQYINRAPQCLRELIDWGIDIKLSDQRMIFTSGTDLMKILLRKARSVGVELFEDIAILDLLTKDGRVTGALGLDVRSGEFVCFHCKAVIMATGGWHKAFWPNTGMRDLSGGGIAMAHRAGATIGNMEFITFCCNVFYSPPAWKGSIAPYVLSLVSGGKLTNVKGEDILRNYDPFVVEKGTRTEWNKSFVSHVSSKEIRSGNGTANGGIYYSRGDVPLEQMENWASMLFPGWKYKALDLTEWGQMIMKNKPVEVGPAVEYFEGGIVVNERFETSIEGLYAAGECNQSLFGANRVFSAITEIIVQGTDAGAFAGDFAKSAATPAPDPEKLHTLIESAEQSLKREGDVRVSQLRRTIQEKAHQYMGPIRNRQDLQEFIEYLETVKKDELPNLSTLSNSHIYNKEWLDVLELPNMVHLLECASRSALARNESRGVHYREDFPQTDNDNWLLESTIKGGSPKVEVDHRPLTITSMSPPSGLVPYLDFVKQMMEAHSDTGGHH